MKNQKVDLLETITLAGGCFWCTEAVFQQVRGVAAVESGYCNGHTQQVNYEAVCTGQTGYAEVVQVTFNPTVVPLETLLDIFFVTHDPTSLNRQGADVGTQYRSGIYCHTPEQLQQVQAWLAQVRPLWPHPIVTEVAMLERYQRAEDYHQNYFVQHPFQGYCMAVVAPKVEKFANVFKDWRK